MHIQFLFVNLTREMANSVTKAHMGNKYFRNITRQCQLTLLARRG